MQKYKVPILIFFLFVFNAAYGQDAVIKILDQQLNQPVPDAIVCFETLNGKVKSNSISDSSGIVKNSITQRSVIAISCIGYVTKMDTIDPGQSVTVLLKPTVYKVDEVVITGQMGPVKADQSIYKIDVIDSRQILDKGANNLAELLANELKIRTFNNTFIGTNLSIQGLSGEHVKILVDGIPVIGRQNGILDLNQILLSNVDHIEFIEGPMSVAYGSNALAGVINIITKEPMHSKYIANLNGYYESVGVYNFNGSLAYRLKEHTISGNGGRNFFGGYSTVDTSRSKQWKPKMQYTGSLDYILTANNHKLQIGTNYFKEELRNKGSVFRNQGTYMAIDEYHYTTRADARINYLKSFRNNNRLELIAGYSYYNKTKKTTARDLVTLNEEMSEDPSAQDTSVFRNLMTRFTYSDQAKALLNYQVGFDGNMETGKGKRLNGSKQIGDYAGFASAILFPDHKFNTQAGVRVIYNTKFTAPLVYSLNFRYAPTDNVLLRASYGKGFRTPSLKELYLYFVDINHNIIGNTQLKAEHSDNFNVSAVYKQRFNKHVISVDVMLFYNTFKDKISLLRLGNTNKYSYYNVAGNYITRGAELNIQYQMHPRFTFNAGMNILGRSKIENLHRLYNSTDYTTNFTYKNLRYLFRLSAFYKYTGDWYDATVQYSNQQTVERIVPSYMKGYHTMDVTLSRPFFNNSLEIAIGCKNVFNNTNVFSYGSSGDNAHPGTDAGNTPVGWGRTVFMRASYNFNKL